MTDPFIGEIRLFPYTFAPRGWALCNGQVLSIAQNTALFSLIGTIYGGDGRTTFALPDLRGRVAVSSEIGFPMEINMVVTQGTGRKSGAPGSLHMAWSIESHFPVGLAVQRSSGLCTRRIFSSSPRAPRDCPSRRSRR